MIILSLMLLMIIGLPSRCEPYSPLNQDGRGNTDNKQNGSSQTGQNWRAATYRGLTIGKSTRADIYRILGKPKWVSSSTKESKKPGSETQYGYEGSEKIIGKFALIISVNKKGGKIESLRLSPEDLSMEDAIKYFGIDYVETRYAFCGGFEDTDSAPIYESPEGQLLFLEYRRRGIALSVNYQRKVTEILYDKQSPGFPSQKSCRFVRNA